MATAILNGALFAIIEEAGEAVLTLMEDIDETAFERSRLTRHEVRRQLLTIADSAREIPPDARKAMPELDWNGWLTLGHALADKADDNETIWFGIRSLTPATLMWLRVYRQNQPELFRMDG